MRESFEKRRARTQTIIQRLKRYYPDAHCALHHSNPLELLVATILSAQCTDERVNMVTPALFKKYKKAADYAAADLSQLEAMIRSTGFFRAKAKSLKGMGEGLVKDHHGEVPKDLEQMMKLPGVGRKTANVVLGNAFGMATGIVVDTHVKRLSFRLGLTSAKAPDKVEQDLVQLVPKKDWINFSHWLIFHGRRICKARKPQCEICPLEGECPKNGVKH
ncbi:MAG: endonuclease III [Bdellovibrionales bacterium]|nr:endonuclease III [Bdellovibrionales bacterium]